MVRVGVWLLLRLERFDLDLGHDVPLHADMIAATWRVRLRLSVRTANLVGPQQESGLARRPLFDGGIANGRADLRASADELRFHLARGARARLGVLVDSAAEGPELGDPTDVSIRFEGVWRRAEKAIEIPEVHATLAGATLSGSISLRDLDTVLICSRKLPRQAHNW